MHGPLWELAESPSGTYAPRLRGGCPGFHGGAPVDAPRYPGGCLLGGKAVFRSLVRCLIAADGNRWLPPDP